MKIHPSLVSKIYKAGAPAEPHTEKAAPSPAAGKTDQVIISPEGAALRGVSRLAQAIAKELEQEPSAQRIEQLRDAVTKGEYWVPTERLANAILGIYA